MLTQLCLLKNFPGNICKQLLSFNCVYFAFKTAFASISRPLLVKYTETNVMKCKHESIEGWYSPWSVTIFFLQNGIDQELRF